MAVEHGESPSEYIAHHLTHLKVGSGFWTWHIDTLFMSALLAFAVSFTLWFAARGERSTKAPTGLTAFVEWIYDWVDQQVAGIYPGQRRFMTALALTLFCWVVAMNTMDLLPVDLPGTSPAYSAPNSGAYCQPPISTAPLPRPSWCWH